MTGLMRPSVLWGTFVILMLVIAKFALQACVFYIPFFGPVIERCSATLAIPQQTIDAYSVQNNLLRNELRELERTIATIGPCRNELDLITAEINEASEVIVVLDTSSSMYQWAKYPEDASEAEVAEVDESSEAMLEELFELFEGGITESDMPEMLSRFNALTANRERLEKTRWTVAREAIRSIFEVPPGDIPMSLWGFGACGELPEKLLPDKDGITPRVFLDGLAAYMPTALSEAIDGIPAIAGDGNGLTVESGLNVVIFTDGLQSCPEQDNPADVCAAAARTKAKLPFAWLHVVALADNLEKLSCISSASGGVLIRADETDKLSDILRYVASQSR